MTRWAVVEYRDEPTARDPGARVRKARVLLDLTLRGEALARALADEMQAINDAAPTGRDRLYDIAELDGDNP